MIHHKTSSAAWLCAGGLALAACAADGAPSGPQHQMSAVAPSVPLVPLVPNAAGTPATNPGAAGSGAPMAPVGMAGAPAITPPPPSNGLPRAGSAAPTRPSMPMGAAGAAPAAPMVTNPKDCPPAPMDATPQAATALAAVNTYRIAAGAACVNLVNTISAGATAHCNYYAMYKSGDMCIADPHGEVMSCMGFTGASPGARSKAAGYTMGGGGEVMAFLNDPQRSVDTWVNSVWHRTPILDPSTYDMGYGFAAAGCDVIDFGKGMQAAANALVVYPYDGETNVPPSFNGALEGPMPPAPPTGWPSGLPVSVHGKGLAITEHVITLDGDATPIEHMWLDGNSADVDASLKYTLKTVNFMYSNKPFAANTKYHVKVTGMYSGGMVTKEWSFTTGAARRF